VAALEARGIEPRIHMRDLPKLEDWQRELLGFIREADAVVFIVSPNSISSAVCVWEVEQVTKLNKRLAPIVLRDLIARIGRRAIKRRNAWIGGLAAGLVVAIGLAGVAVWQSYVADAQRKQVIEREMNRRAALARDLDNSLTADRRMSAISAVQTSPRRSLPLMAHLPLYASYGTPTHGDVALRCRTCTSVQTTPCWRSRWSLVPRD